MASPAKFAHVVFRSGRLAEMCDWYCTVLEAHVAFKNDFIAFLTYDDEHHRVAIVDTGATESPSPTASGLEHMAFTYASLADLVDTYERLKGLGIRPYWSINHGPTTSCYYRDPDGNQVELQIDNFESTDALNAWFRSGAFAENPIGVEFDPEELVARYRAGTPLEELVRRHVNAAVADVAVVGYGPVGATLANLLGRLGYRVDVFESTTSVYHLPRAAHFDGEVMRIFQAAGLAEAIAPVTAPIAGMHFVNGNGEKLFGYDAPQGRGPNGWANNYMFYQPDLERVLRAGADRFPNVHVHLGHEVVSITQDDERVELGVRALHDDTMQRVPARYLLGCDGARSVARSAAGITLEDLHFDQPWLVVDTVLTTPVNLPPMSVQYCDPARPITYVPMGGDRRRWEFMLLPGETAAAMEDPDRVRALLAPWVEPADVEIVRAVVYTFHAVIASPWRNGRLFVLGDAAHQMPPFLGQGMCAGIRDAQNLSWKLDLVLAGAASPGLLDTYEAERSPHVRTIIETAVNAGHIIQTTDPAIATTRDAHFLGDANGPGAVGMPGLAAGVVASGTARAGELLAQPVIDGALLDDRCGPRFTIVGRQNARHIMAEPAVAFWDSLPGAFVTDDKLGAWLDEAGGKYVVLRPDRYVYGVARDTSELDALADRLRTQLGSVGCTR